MSEAMRLHGTGAPMQAPHVTHLAARNLSTIRSARLTGTATNGARQDEENTSRRCAGRGPTNTERPGKFLNSQAENLSTKPKVGQAIQEFRAPSSC